MKIKLLALAVGGFILTGCYHVTVTHTKPGVTQQSAAAAPKVVDVPFSHSFVYGLVPPAEVNVKDQCAKGVSKVETKMSFVNGLVGGLTWSLYTPVTAKVTCAQ